MGDLVGSTRALRRALLALRLTSIGVIAAAMLCVPASANAAEPRTLTVGALTLTACDSVEVEGSQAWCGTLPRPWDPALPESGTLNVGFVLTLPTGAARAAAAAPRSSATSAIVALEGGPGWGGMTPCMTERKDTSGMASARNGRPVSRVSPWSTGSSSRNPTANHELRPTVIASAMMHQPAFSLPKNRLKPCASTVAPPDSESSLPRMAPRQITQATPPSVRPSPS